MALAATPTSGNQGKGAPHLVFVPSAGMGHLLPFTRLIAALANEGVDISVVTALPTVSEAEADHLAALFAAFPAIQRIDFNLPPLDDSAFAGTDPFLLRWESLRRSAYLFGPLIAGTTRRVSAIITDVTLASHVIPIAKDELHLPCHILFSSCATMLSFAAYFPTYLDGANADHLAGDVNIPGIGLVPVDCAPQVLRNPNSLFTKHFISNGRLIADADGILVNTFDALEPAALAALRGGKVVPGFPPVFAVGPLKSTSVTGSDTAVVGASLPVAWLDGQPARSVVYVAFGNRNAAALDQTREIGAGLEASGCRFLWVLKTTVVDREDTAELKDVLGDGFLGRVQGRGLVTKDWVDQEAILKHPAIGLYLSHCGWNSVTEAAAYGVPMLAWPMVQGDQRLVATVIRSGGFGLWMEHWSWDGENLVGGVEIGEKVKEVMGDEAIAARAAKLREEATMAVAHGGSSYRNIQEFLATLKITLLN